MDIEATMRDLSAAIIAGETWEICDRAYVLEDWLTLHGRTREARVWHNLAVAYDA